MTSTLLLDGLQVPVEIGGSSRRARLTVEADGSLRIRAANDVSSDELQRFLTSKRTWIYRKLAEKEELRIEATTKELVDGEGFLYLGRSYRLKIDPSASDRVRLVDGRLILPRSLNVGGAQAIIDWYRRSGERWVRPRINGWANRLQVEPRSVTVADLGHKWGVATRTGELKLHWASMQLRPALMDYLMVHEAAHLREPHHGPAFWRLVERVLPNSSELKSELATVGGRLWFGEVECDD